ncbi:hypothetical protein [Streptomyces turgidiscabies]|uniref:hypothetical protein n=1 Tax=Streptomyces turgidiscabies TaxID=85558 RepID=UPI0027D8664F|nr:hypothetical protein [Streptomyces turgidiscabies]
MTRGDLTDAEWELIEPHLPLGRFTASGPATAPASATTLERARTAETTEPDMPVWPRPRTEA